MDVSKRIKELRGTIDNATIAPVGKSAILQQIRQFEVEIVKAIQTARQEGYAAGFNNRATWDAEHKDTQCLGCPDKDVKCHNCIDD